MQRDYVDARRLRGAVDRLGDGPRHDCLESWDVADVFGLEVWLQVFFGAQMSNGNLMTGQQEYVQT